jgi:cob(I)alamin adenosyltransferase
MKVYTKQEIKEPQHFWRNQSPKRSRPIESYGTVDELNSHIGLIRDQEMNAHYKEILIEIQDRLFTVGAILATPPEKEVKKNGELR